MIISYPMKGWLDVYPSPGEEDFAEIECDHLNEIPGVRAYPKALRIPYTAEGLYQIRDLLNDLGGYSWDRWRPAAAMDPMQVHVDSQYPGLYPHQLDGVRWLLQRGGGLLCDEMGTGKSRTAAVAAFQVAIWNRRAPVLIVGPKFTRSVWHAELNALGLLSHDESNFIALESRDPLSESSKHSRADFDRWMRNPQSPYTPWVFIHYDVLAEWQGLIYNWGFASAIVDEIHYVREGRNARSKATGAVVGPIRFRVGLTGTPLVNKPSELWHLLTLVNGPGTWGHPLSFRTRYSSAMRDEYGLRDGDPSNVEELRTRLAGSYLRRTVDDVGAAMVPFARQSVLADLGAQEDSYFAAEAAVNMPVLVRALLEGRMGEDVLVQLGRLRKLTAKAKIPTTAAYVASLLDAGESVVVFTHERATAGAVAQAVTALRKGQETSALVVTGELPEQERVDAVALFQRVGTTQPMLLCATYGALGVGVTLTAARYVVLHDLEYTFASVLQAEKRAHRLSSSRGPVTAAWILAEGSVDEIMAQILLKKAAYLEQTLGQTEASKAAAELDLRGVAGTDDFEERMLQWAKGA
jgi:SWI/SNF-related matrix-associated actin-dependent regulator 1 of chromatin subfamily A